MNVSLSMKVNDSYFKETFYLHMGMHEGFIMWVFNYRQES